MRFEVGDRVRVHSAIRNNDAKVGTIGVVQHATYSLLSCCGGGGRRKRQQFLYLDSMSNNGGGVRASQCEPWEENE